MSQELWKKITEYQGHSFSGEWEVYFKDELVCGVSIARMTSEQTGEFSIILKSMVEFY